MKNLRPYTRIFLSRPQLFYGVILMFSFSVVVHFSIVSPLELFDAMRARLNEKIACNIEHTQLEARTSESLTVEEIYQYFYFPNSSACSFAMDFGFNVVKPIYGTEAGFDGFKAVCFDPVPISPLYKDCLVYSFGINNDWSFDEAFEEYGCYVFAFDPSMNKEDHRHSKRITFFNMGLSYRDIDKAPGNSWKLKTLASIYKMLQHEGGIIDFLKIDIEWHEWETLPQIFDSGMLKLVKQLALDVHLHTNATEDNFRMYYNTLRTLEKDHGFYRFSSRAGPWNERKYYEILKREDKYTFEMSWYNSNFLKKDYMGVKSL